MVTYLFEQAVELKLLRLRQFGDFRSNRRRYLRESWFEIVVCVWSRFRRGGSRIEIDIVVVIVVVTRSRLRRLTRTAGLVRAFVRRRRRRRHRTTARRCTIDGSNSSSSSVVGANAFRFELQPHLGEAVDVVHVRRLDLQRALTSANRDMCLLVTRTMRHDYDDDDYSLADQ
jgi:hypothetical protein